MLQASKPQKQQKLLNAPVTLKRSEVYREVV